MQPSPRIQVCGDCCPSTWTMQGESSYFHHLAVTMEAGGHENIRQIARERK